VGDSEESAIKQQQRALVKIIQLNIFYTMAQRTLERNFNK